MDASELITSVPVDLVDVGTLHDPLLILVTIAFIVSVLLLVKKITFDKLFPMDLRTDAPVLTTDITTLTDFLDTPKKRKSCNKTCNSCKCKTTPKKGK